MIDFKNGKYVKLKKTDTIPQDLNALLIAGEDVIGVYRGVRDYVAFTSKRVVACNVQGIGAKIDYTSLPYAKVQAYSVETAGIFDRDSELELYFSGIGKIKFEFSGKSDIVEISKIISQYVL